MPGAPPQKPPEIVEDTSSFTRVTPVTPVSPSGGLESADGGSQSGSSLGLGECSALTIDNAPDIAVRAPSAPEDAEVDNAVNISGFDDADDYNLVLPASCRNSIGSYAVFGPSARNSKESAEPGITSDNDGPETSNIESNAEVRPSILREGSKTLGKRLQEASKVVRLASLGSKRASEGRGSQGMVRMASINSAHSWRDNFGRRKSDQSTTSSQVSATSSLRWAKTVRRFFKQHVEESWWTYLFGHSLSEAANMRRLGNKSPDDTRVIQVMSALNDQKHKREQQSTKGSQRAGPKSRLREEEDAATILRDSSIEWSYFDIFEKDIRDEHVTNLRMIRAFSRCATWSRAAAKIICMWSIWYSTCLFFFWDVLHDDPSIGSNTAIWHILQAIDLICDFVYLFITLSRLVTTIADVTSGVEICLPERVVWKVLNKPTFWIDFLTCFPWTLNCTAAPEVFPRWLMLLKTLRGWHIFERSHTWLVFQQDLQTIPLLLLIILLFGHVLACVYYYIILTGIPVLDRDKLFPEWSFAQCYMYSYRICVYLLLGEDMEDITSSGDFFDVNLGSLGFIQDLFVTWCMPFGSLINALVFSRIIVIVQRRSALETIHIEHENQLRQTMISYDLPSSLQLRMLAYYKYEKIHQAHATFGTIFKNLSPQLNFELRLFLYYEQVTGVPLFESCQPRVLRELVLRLDDRLFLPGDYICRFGDKGEEMYFICKGTCSVIAEDMTHLLTELGPGGHFGEIAVIMGQKRTAYVRADGFCLTASLSKDNFEDIMKEYPEELRVILSKMSSEKLQSIKDIGRHSISAGQLGVRAINNIAALQQEAESRLPARADEDAEEESSDEDSSSEEDEEEEDDEAPSDLPASTTASDRKEDGQDVSAEKPSVVRRQSVLKKADDGNPKPLCKRSRSVSILATAEVHHTHSHQSNTTAVNAMFGPDGRRRVSFASFDTQHLMHDINEMDEDADKVQVAAVHMPKCDSSKAAAALPKIETQVDKIHHAPITKDAKSSFGVGTRWNRVSNALGLRRRPGSQDSSAASQAPSASSKPTSEETLVVVDAVTEATPASSSTAPVPEATPAFSSSAPATEARVSSGPPLITNALPAAREAWTAGGPGVSGFGALAGVGSNTWASPRPRPAGGLRRTSIANHSMIQQTASVPPRPGGLGRRASLAGGSLTNLAGLANRQPLFSSSPRGSAVLEESDPSNPSAFAAAGTAGTDCAAGQHSRTGSKGSTGSKAASSNDPPAGASTMAEKASQKVSALLDAGGFAERAGEAPSESGSASDEPHREKKRRSTLTVPPRLGTASSSKRHSGKSSGGNSPTSSGNLMPMRPPNRSAYLNSQRSSPSHSSPSDSQTTGSLCLGSEVGGAHSAASVPAAPEEEGGTTHQELAEKLDREVAQGRREPPCSLATQLKTLNKAVDELVDVQLKVGRCIKTMEKDSEDLEKALHEVGSLWQTKSKALQRDDHLFQEVLEDIKLQVEAAHEGVELLLEDVRGELDNQEIDLAAQAMNIVNSQNEQDSRPHTPILLLEPEHKPSRRKSSMGGARAAEAMLSPVESGKESRRATVTGSRRATVTESRRESSSVNNEQAERERDREAREQRRRPSMREARSDTPNQENDPDRRRSVAAASGQHRRSLAGDTPVGRPNVIV